MLHVHACVHVLTILRLIAYNATCTCTCIGTCIHACTCTCACLSYNSSEASRTCTYTCACTRTCMIVCYTREAYCSSHEINTVQWLIATQRFTLANGKKLCGYSYEINKEEYNLTIIILCVHMCTICFQYAIIVTKHNIIIIILSASIGDWILDYLERQTVFH